MKRPIFLLLALAALVVQSCPSIEEQEEIREPSLDSRWEQAYMKMSPSSQEDFQSSVYCLYTGRLVPLEYEIKLSQRGEVAIISSHEVKEAAEELWMKAEGFDFQEEGLYTVFVRQSKGEKVSRYRFIAVKNFGDSLQLTVAAKDFMEGVWAQKVIEYTQGKDVSSFTDPQRALGSWFSHQSSEVTDPSYDVVSLGNGGSLILEWGDFVVNGEGPDFAVFENGLTAHINSVFGELAFVEVSSNGKDFVRFSSVSLGRQKVSQFAQIPADSVFNLAGARPLGWGSVFDLDELAGSLEVRSGILDLNRVKYLKLIDISGCGEEEESYSVERDSFSNIIFDPFKTTGSAGFDMAGTVLLHSKKESL